MRLYTRPRPLPADMLRRDDEVALNKTTGLLIVGQMEFIDEHMAMNVRWSLVTGLGDYERADGQPGTVVRHALGNGKQLSTARLIVREWIEIDPLTYVRTVMGDDGSAA